ncbi:hypothetical protein NIES267_38240 [Calothrix parasitica NIES-267]|uniref:DUF928 domain-containing protein n=1 Tax=Calothrix parasitica NIES-267 TaxID=1973488 RepID=A0A1Z4LTE6_9CYAN|nr:hypothetical protein NIES267_38240 [Calothrix parasitica NIES-267]
MLTYALPGFAQSKFPIKDNSLTSEIVFQDSLEPPGEPEPKDTKGSGSRDPKKCSNEAKDIKALMPESNYGLTFQKLPSIFLRLPKTKARKVMLSFRDLKGKYYQRAFLPINANSIVSFSLPEDKPALTIGRNYQWSLVVVCGDTVQPDDPTFQGWVQRVERTPRVDKELIGKTAVEKAKWYGKKGYWYEMIEAIEQARKTQPNDLKLSADLQKNWR